jgi:hypothetical protein
MMDAVGSERGTPGASGLGPDQPVTAREAVDKMVQAGMLDDLMNQVDNGDLQLTGDRRVSAGAGETSPGGWFAGRADRPFGL